MPRIDYTTLPYQPQDDGSVTVEFTSVANAKNAAHVFRSRALEAPQRACVVTITDPKGGRTAEQIIKLCNGSERGTNQRIDYATLEYKPQANGSVIVALDIPRDASNAVYVFKSLALQASQEDCTVTITDPKGGRSAEKIIAACKKGKKRKARNSNAEVGKKASPGATLNNDDGGYDNTFFTLEGLDQVMLECDTKRDEIAALDEVLADLKKAINDNATGNLGLDIANPECVPGQEQAPMTMEFLDALLEGASSAKEDGAQASRGKKRGRDTEDLASSGNNKWAGRITRESTRYGGRGVV